MNVSSINGSSYAASSIQSNSQLQAIDKQIAELQKSIQSVRQNKSMDTKSKSEKVKEYQEQIAQLQQQKAQVQAEARKAQQSSVQSDAQLAAEQEQSSGQQPSIDIGTQKSLIEMDNATKMQRQTGGVRADLEGEIRIAESKSYLREADPATAAEARGKINFLDSTIAGRLEHAAEGLEEAGSAEKTTGVNKTTDATRTDHLDHAGEDETNAAVDEKHHGTGRMEPGQFLFEEV